jgi:HEPN domain-containing protein
MNEATARMLRLARRDLRAVQGMLDNREMFPDEIFGFHAQQAVEKAAKAWLDGRGTLLLVTQFIEHVAVQVAVPE